MVNLAALYKDTGDIPWVLGLSGGKDSTALTMHLLETMEQLPPPVLSSKRVPSKKWTTGGLPNTSACS